MSILSWIRFGCALFLKRMCGKVLFTATMLEIITQPLRCLAILLVFKTLIWKHLTFFDKFWCSVVRFTFRIYKKYEAILTIKKRKNGKTRILMYFFLTAFCCWILNCSSCWILSCSWKCGKVLFSATISENHHATFMLSCHFACFQTLIWKH